MIRQDLPINQLLFSTVRIEVQTPENQTSVGTGFVVHHKHQDKDYLFLTTNKHVIESSNKGKLFFTMSGDAGPLFGQKFDVSAKDFEKMWFVHPANLDVAVMNFAAIIRIMEERGKKFYFRSIPLSLVPAKEKEGELSALEEIIFIGYPSGIYDEKNLLPIIRRGITAAPVSIDYDGKPLFLIDASVFPGSSGSPVFIYNQGAYFTPQATKVGIRTIFLGVLSQLLVREETGIIEFVKIPTQETPVLKFKQVLNLGVVIKARVIVETIEAFLKQGGV